MIVDINSTFGEGLDLGTTGVLGDAIDLGVAYNIGAGANRPPVLHIVATDAVGAGNLQLCTSEDGETAGTVILDILFNATDDGDVLFSGIIPTVPKASGQYLVLNNASSSSGTINAHILNNAPAQHIYPGK